MRTSSIEQIILEVLSKEHAHLTSNQIYEVIRPRLPAVNPSTVYRALERLTGVGKYPFPIWEPALWFMSY
jgi:Fe2+ or Zn2+ uptake regulation protein